MKLSYQKNLCVTGLCCIDQSLATFIFEIIRVNNVINVHWIA